MCGKPQSLIGSEKAHYFDDDISKLYGFADVHKNISGKIGESCTEHEFDWKKYSPRHFL